MGNIINTKEDSNYTIKKFTFDKIDSTDKDFVLLTQNPFEENSVQQESSPDNSENEHRNIPTTLPQDNKELLEKIEQLTSDVVTLQMELEKQETTFTQKIETEKQQAYEQGKTEGLKIAQEQYSEDLETHKIQLLRSIELLDEHKQLYDKAIHELESDLLQGSFILAQKIIIKEIDAYSSEIATQIAQSLLKTVHEGSEVTLKVNPIDFEDISSHFKDNRIKIESDEAIQKGGVVILSDSGNIDGDILTRYKQSLQLLQKES